MEELLGYGTYLFQASGPFANFDLHSTFGLFTYDDCSTDTANSTNPGNSFFRELDFEMAKWGDVCCTLFIWVCLLVCFFLWSVNNSEFCHMSF